MRKFYLSFILASLSLVANDGKTYEPLYAGTLLAIYPKNADPGRLSFQPYIFATHNYGLYNQDWNLSKESSLNQTALEIFLETGITPFLDISLLSNGFYNHSQHTKTFRYGDTFLYLGFQMAEDQKDNWIPDFRFLLQETFPTGQYDHLNPEKHGTDIAGFGSYQTGGILVLRKVFHTFPSHPFNINLNLYYIIPSSVNIHGLSVYGGGLDTRGKARLGNQTIVNIGIEFSLTKNWVIGTDFHYVHYNRSPFSGKTGIDAQGKPHLVGLPSSEVFSIAPCLEYNFNENFSLAAGVWQTLGGRNNLAFTSYVANIYYYF